MPLQRNRMLIILLAALNRFGLMMLVVKLKFGYVVIVNGEENANGHQDEVAIAANEGKVVEPRVALSCSRNDLV